LGAKRAVHVVSGKRITDSQTSAIRVIQGIWNFGDESGRGRRSGRGKRTGRIRKILDAIKKNGFGSRD
jgi:hypothetical protein